ncbi:SIR2-domain-containing protein, partial [Fistulina hepatica ATCC 64428]
MYSYHSRVNPNPRNAFTVLDEPSLQGLVGYMKSRKCRHVVLMVSISTSAGIPDFRSPRTGELHTWYLFEHNLAKLNLPFPEAVFDLSYFRENPQPFYTLAHELYPGKYNPTLTHAFIRVLDNHNLLHRCFTQNIDTLERRAGVPPSKIVEAHGSFASQRCIGCRRPFDDERMKRCVLNRIVPRCETCNSLVKPDIVFFGESLPLEFARAAREVPLADLLIIIGTSLTVNPFAALANMPSELCPRVLINLEQVGDLGFRPDDVLLLGKCDEVVHKLCRELGWENEL